MKNFLLITTEMLEICYFLNVWNFIHALKSGDFFLFFSKFIYLSRTYIIVQVLLNTNLSTKSIRKYNLIILKRILKAYLDVLNKTCLLISLNLKIEIKKLPNNYVCLFDFIGLLSIIQYLWARVDSKTFVFSKPEKN